jgi:hypothetical protein
MFRLSQLATAACGLALAAALLWQGCATKTPASNPPKVASPEAEITMTTTTTTGTTTAACRTSTAMPSTAGPQLDCAAPPSTFSVSSFFTGTPPASTMAQAGPTFDAWAWSSFAAFNWPAKTDTTQPTGYVRGIPDVNASFTQATGTEVVVWETFKEKREVFNGVVTADSWQQLTFPPNQLISAEGGPIPECTSQDLFRAKHLPGGAHRRILQASKLAPALATGPNTLDETAEVASPAQEPQATLCHGYTAMTTPTLAQCQATFPPPMGLTTTSPYPPTMTNPRAGVGPRVFDPSGNIVLYEVRVNYDYFAYVLSKGLNLVNNLNPPPPPPPLAAPPYNLPWRTSAPHPPGTTTAGPFVGTMPGNSTVSYDPNVVQGLYSPAPATPPPIGSVQVKSAWRKLSFADPTYHTTEAVYFVTNTSVPGNTCYKVGTFGLIGLHIIQRVHMGTQNDTKANSVGGTFIFATWEHNSIGSGAGYSYVNFLSNGGIDQSSPTRYPGAGAIPVQRLQAYPLQSTQNVNAAVYSQLPANSVWRNYRLIGTQFYANVNNPPAMNAATSLLYNQPYYLANLVVETNSGLQNFQGLPPKITPIAHYGTGFTPTTTAYVPTLPNVSWNGNADVMGGCMGCHGVAQLLGSNFSFVLLDGQKGAGIDTATQVTIPPAPPPPPAPSPPPPPPPSSRGSARRR